MKYDGVSERSSVAKPHNCLGTYEENDEFPFLSFSCVTFLLHYSVRSFRTRARVNDRRYLYGGDEEGDAFLSTLPKPTDFSLSLSLSPVFGT